MSLADPLVQPALNALLGRQAEVALRLGSAVRFHASYGQFASIPDHGPESLAALGKLVAAHGEVIVLEAAPPPVPGTAVLAQAPVWQMAAERIGEGPAPDFEILDLGEADAAEMLALATLTRPGPFFARTHQLGRFVGVRRDGVLVAMAGERMKPPGHTEVRGVCTLPEHRGRGYAAALMRHVAGAILARGEIPFLHSYADNVGAIALYEFLGFRLTRETTMTLLGPTEPNG